MCSRAALLLLAFGTPAFTLPLLPADATSKTVTRFAFGSCNKHDKPAFFWPHVAARNPDFFLWLGDIVYADEKVIWKWRIPANATKIRHLLTLQKSLPEYAAFAAKVPVTGIYDDHDVGTNDADATIPQGDRRGAQQALLDFLDEPQGSVRRSRDGVFVHYLFGQAPRRVRLIVLDNRSHREPYDHPEGRQDMLGPEQWAWLEDVLRTTQAEVTIIAAGLQIISRGDPWVAESWSKMPASQAKLISLLAATNTTGTFFLSGDMHIAEAHRLTCSVLGYPLFDFTASGMTHSWGGWLVGSAWRMIMMAPTRIQGRLYTERHWGEIEIDWPGPNSDRPPTIVYRAISAEPHDVGRVVFDVRLPPATLNPSSAGLQRLNILFRFPRDPGDHEEHSFALRALERGDPTAGGIVSGPWSAGEPTSRFQLAAATRLYAGNGSVSAGQPSLLGYPLLANGEPYPAARSAAYASTIGLEDAVRMCAASDPREGFSPACARVMYTCDPKITLADSAYYFAGHALLLSLMWGVVGAGMALACCSVRHGHKWPGGRGLWVPVGVAVVAGVFGLIRALV